MLSVGEVGVRIAGTQKCQPIEPQAGSWETMIGDRDLLWKLEPNRKISIGEEYTTINEIGLRESLLPSTTKRKGEKRIIVTGDSSIYGWGVKDKETYAYLLEQELRKRFPTPIEVINLGVPGYSTEQTKKLLQKVGWQYEPDLLIVSNIFSDCNIDAFQDRNAMSLTNPNPGTFHKILQSSRLYCAGYMTWVNHQATLNQETNRVLMPGIPTGPNAAVQLEQLNENLALSRVPIPQYLENLNYFHEEMNKRNGKMILAPLAQEWDVGIWNVPMPEPSADHVLPWFPYRDAQKQWAAKKNIPIISFAKTFQQYKQDPNRLFVDNMHPSKDGNLLMAKEVADYLQRNPSLLGLQNVPSTLPHRHNKRK